MSVDDVKAALLGIVTSVAKSSGAAISVADTWTQAANSFASIMQNSTHPQVPDIQRHLGETSQAASTVVGAEVGLEMSINELIATL